MSVRDHIATSLSIEPEDYDDAPISQRGGLGNLSAELSAIASAKAEALAKVETRQYFVEQSRFAGLFDELNVVVAA